MSEQTIQFTQEHFEAFKAEALRWMEFFGLHSWEIVFEQKDKDDSDPYGRAYCYTNFAARQCKLVFCTSPKTDNPLPDDLMAEARQSAKHEVLELLLDGLETTAAKCATVVGMDRTLLNAARHEVIHQVQMLMK